MASENQTEILFQGNFSKLEEDPWRGLNVPYAVSEVLVATAAIVGNSLVIVVYLKDRRLRRRTKYYIISLAIADFLVGTFGIPFAILASVGLPRNFYLCLFNMSLLVVLCTISIFCLVAVSIDRYWAILHPMSYSRNVRSKTAIGIIIICWLAGALVGFLPLFGWNEGGPTDRQCFFVEVMNYNYLVFLYFATIIAPAILLAAFYAHIYRVVLQQVRRMVTLSACSSSSAKSSGGMLRVLGAAQKREVKATQNLSIIVLFFIVCWFPLYTINFVKAFCRECNINPILTNSCIILSHLNSSFNPFLYAYHLKDFRVALHNLLFCSNQVPVCHPKSPYFKQRPEINTRRNSKTTAYFFEDEVTKMRSNSRESQLILRQLHTNLWTLTQMSPTRFPYHCRSTKHPASSLENRSGKGKSHAKERNCSNGVPCRSQSLFAFRTIDIGRRFTDPEVEDDSKEAIKTIFWSCDDLRIVSDGEIGVTTKLKI